jgi:hypothetical protein
MNERIRELAEQAGFQSIVRGDHIVFDISTKENLKEFAELIVKECAGIANKAEPYQSSDLIRKHFGVKE